MRLVVLAVAACLSTTTACRRQPPRQVVEDMIEIPTGAFLGQRIVCPKLHTDRLDYPQPVGAYRIDRRLVSCDDYAVCVAAGGCTAVGREECTGNIVVATFEAATAYCVWRGAQLPSYAQWSRAIRGVDGRRYPTGPAWDEERGCERRTTTRTSLPRCENISAAGVEFAVKGHFGEWTRDVSCDEFGAGAVVADLLGEALDRIAYARSPAEFRCARDGHATAEGSGR